MLADWRIVRDDLTHPQVVALLELHLRAAYEHSPPGSVFALDRDGLRASGVTVWTLWEGEMPLGMGALKALGDGHGELKSMRTAPGQTRRGVARAMLDHRIAQARAAGHERLSLETGSNEPFAAARALYERAGFSECGPFAEYSDRAFSRYYTLALA